MDIPTKFLNILGIVLFLGVFFLSYLEKEVW